MSSVNPFVIMWREVRNDRLALVGLALFIIIVTTIYIWALFIDPTVLTAINFQYRHQPPSLQFWLGTDIGGRPIFETLILSARNSFNIAFLITFFATGIGVMVGLLTGFYAGHLDNVVMRIIDFVGMIPFIMLIIVFVSLVPNYGVITFSAIFIAFGWMGTARLIRSKALQQGKLEYVAASKTLGTRNIVIIFREVLPNLVSIITSTLTIALAANMGIETGLTFLGFGLPHGTPSLGRLVAHASNPHNMQHRMWLWLPAALLIVVMMLCINFVGQALNRAADARKRKV